MARSAIGDFEGALGPFEKACQLSQYDPGACYYLGRNYYVLSQFSRSEDTFRQALKEAPDDWRLHRGLGLTSEALARHDDAEEHLLKSVALTRGSAPAGEDPRIDLGSFYYRRGRAEDAIPILEDALGDHPEAAGAHFELARCLAESGQNEVAAKHLEDAVRAEPGNWPAHQLLGKVYMRLGEVDAGRRHLGIARKGIVADTYGSRTVR
jgi:Flp pilus assembly protein TadD